MVIRRITEFAMLVKTTGRTGRRIFARGAGQLSTPLISKRVEGYPPGFNIPTPEQ